MKFRITAEADFEDLPEEWREEIEEEVKSALRFYNGIGICIEVVTGE